MQILFGLGPCPTTNFKIWLFREMFGHPCTKASVRSMSKMLNVIKMSKTVPIMCPRSVDIESHIIESHWPLPSQGHFFQPFTLHTVKLIRSSPYTELWGTSDPFVSPFFDGICVPMLIVWMVYHATLRSCCAHIHVLTSGRGCPCESLIVVWFQVLT